MRYTVGTRGSRLSLSQTALVISELEKANPGSEYKIKTITTKGDTDSRPLYEMNRRGMFEKEIDAAVSRGEVDFAVHSLKDVPSDLADDLEIACIPRRERPNDILISRDGSDIHSIKDGALVGTSSLRRAAQIKSKRPGLRVGPIRGNIETRIKKAQTTHDGIVLALAGIARLKLDVKYSILDSRDFIPSPGQGALALVSRKDSPVMTMLKKIEHADSRLEAEAERALSEYVESGCRFPVGAHGMVSDNSLTLTAEAFSADGTESLRETITGPKHDAISIGKKAGVALKGRGVADLALNWRKKTEEWNR